MSARISGFRTFLVVVSGVIFATACDPASSPGPSIERSDENGIELVAIRGPDASLDWTFETVLTIPPEVDGEVRFTEVSPWEVGADEDGRLYVLDGDGGRVVVFGRSGREVGSVGRPGRGPGELSEPVALAVTAAGEVAVFDHAAGGIARWGSAGGLPSFDRLETNFWGPELQLASWGILYPSLASDGREGRVVQLVVAAETRTGVLAEMNAERPSRRHFRTVGSAACRWSRSSSLTCSGISAAISSRLSRAPDTRSRSSAGG